MCSICDSAYSSLQELDQRLKILEYHIWSDSTNPLLKERRTELKSQIKRAEKDCRRLEQSLHGEWRPRVSGSSVDPDKYQVSLELL